MEFQTLWGDWVFARNLCLCKSVQSWVFIAELPMGLPGFRTIEAAS